MSDIKTRPPLSQTTEDTIAQARWFHRLPCGNPATASFVAPIVEVADDRDALIAENKILRDLVEDPEVGASCWEAQDPDADPMECGGAWDQNNNLIGETCWEHKKRAAITTTEKPRWVTTFVFSPLFARVLLVKKNRGPDRVKGKWTGVGGKIEPGESPEAAAIREVAEEAGVKLEEVQLVSEMHRPDSMGYVFAAVLPDDQYPKTMTDEPVAMLSAQIDPAAAVAVWERAEDTEIFIEMALKRLHGHGTIYEITVRK